MLLVVDDAWSIEDANWFLVGGRHCATLVTTRRAAVAEGLAPTPGDSTRLDVLSEQAALDLLRKQAPDVVAKHSRECHDLVRELEFLPLAIEIAGRVLCTHMARWETPKQSSVGKLLAELKDASRILSEKPPASMVHLVEETSASIAALLKKSTDYLDEETRERFRYLGAFPPKPATFSLGMLAKTWKVGESEAQQYVDRLIDGGLMQPVGGRRFWIHALLVSLAQALWEDHEE